MAVVDVPRTDVNRAVTFAVEVDVKASTGPEDVRAGRINHVFEGASSAPSAPHSATEDLPRILQKMSRNIVKKKLVSIQSLATFGHFRILNLISVIEL